MNKDKIVSEIRMSYDYDKFVTIVGNRKLNPTNLNKIINSMKEQQLIIPVCVNEKMQVIDGQHRAEACKQLGLPIYYYILEGYGIKEVNRANIVSANWKNENYLAMFVSLGYDEYIKLNQILERYSLSLGNVMKLFATMQETNLSQLTLQFKNGAFTTKDIDKVLNFITALEDFNTFESYKTTSFITAFLRLYLFETYEHDVMEKKLVRLSHILTKKSSSNEYLEVLCDKIYSFGRTKTPIYYSAKGLYSM